MKKALKIVGVVFGLAIVGLVVAASMQPSHFEVKRERLIHADEEAVRPHLRSFRKFNEWNPWNKRDAGIRIEYQGPEEGVGAAYTWSGNNEVGQGEMKITEVTEHRVVSRLHFIAPFEATNQAIFETEPTAHGTVVRWRMDGPQNFMSKLMGVFMDMDKMIGADFETGLANLAGKVESR